MTARTAAGRPAARRIPVWLPLVAAALALLVYAVAFDQGLLLEPLFGKAASANMYLHEFFHDGRHLLGFPCH
ncbi:MAG TPA: CbtB-domain containing protein [Actinomycetota bacterium]